MKIKLIGLLTIILLLFVNITAPAVNIKLQKNNDNIKQIKEEIKYNTNQKITEIIQKINRTVIKQFLEELISIGPRMTNTHGCKKAGDFIYKKFQGFGLEASKHEWSDFGNKWHPGFFNSYNIEGFLQGKNEKDKEVLIFNAHYDTVENTVGADDDGSGVIGVLAAAYALSQYSFNKTIKFVTFSGEEIGLLGSTHYVKDLYENNEEIFVEFNADMIGYAKTKEDEKKIRLSYSEDAEWIIDIVQNINDSSDKMNLRITDKYPMDRDSKRGGSDYFPFLQYGYESVAFWEGAWNRNMHTPRDDITNVNIDYLVNTTRIIAGTMAYLADIDDQPPKITISSPKKGKLYLKDRVLKTFESDKTIVLNNVWIYTDIKTYNSEIKKVEFYYDGKLQHTAENLPYVWNLNKTSIGKHKLETIVYDEKGRQSVDQINFLYLNLLKSK